MPDNLLAPEDEGFFSWLSRPRRALLNALRGEYGMAGDQALDFVLNIPDAALPGDVIPEISGPESDVEVGDLAKIEPGWKKTAVDIAGGAVLDPLTYVPIAGPIAKAAGAARQVARAVPKLDKALTTGRNLVADTMNWHTLTPEQRAIEQSAKATGSMAARASEVEAERIAKMVTPDEGAAVSDAILNVGKNAKDEWMVLDQMRQTVPRNLAENQAAAVKSLQLTETFMKAPPERQKAMIEATNEAVALGQTQADEAFRAGGKSDRPYIMAQYEFEGAPDVWSTAARTLDPETMAKRLNEDKALAAAYKRDLPSSLLKRAGQQGNIVTRQTLGDQLWSKAKNLLPETARDTPFALTNKNHQAAVKKYLDDLIAKNGPERDFAVRAKTLFTGDLKMDPISESVAWFNRNLFKKAATVGVVVPRFSFSVRNSLSAMAQALSTPGARGAALRYPKWMLDRLHDGISAPLDEAAKIFTKGKVHTISDDVNRTLDVMDEAFAASNGSVEGTKNFLRASQNPRAKDALEVLEQNVIDNPINLDDMLREVNPDAPVWKKIANDVWELPANMNRHLENRMRTGLYLAAKKAGQQPPAAAASIRKSLLDYSVPTIENRRMRTWIPFGAFMSQTLPQTAKLLTENVPEGFSRGGLAGGVSSGLAGGLARNAATQMFETDPEAPIYPDMEGKLAIPLGQTPEGRSRYLTSFGLPMEGLGDLPMSTDFRDHERFLGVAANPLVKALYSGVSGKDPYFGTAYGAYDKPYAALAAMGLEAGPLSSGIRKLAGTGVVQPAVHALNIAEPWLDERQGPGLDLLRSTTGVRVRDVDEGQALKLNLEEALRQNPRIKQYTSYYQNTDDPDTLALMEEYEAAKKQIREKRKEAKAQAAATVQ